MTPDTKDLRRPAPDVIDQRQQQIDPAGKNRIDPNDRPDSNRKQPGGSDPAKAAGEAGKATTPAPKEPGGGENPAR